jgi:hypothetical protein
MSFFLVNEKKEFMMFQVQRGGGCFLMKICLLYDVRENKGTK